MNNWIRIYTSYIFFCMLYKLIHAINVIIQLLQRVKSYQSMQWRRPTSGIIEVEDFWLSHFYVLLHLFKSKWNHLLFWYSVGFLRIMENINSVYLRHREPSFLSRDPPLQLSLKPMRLPLLLFLYFFTGI